MMRGKFAILALVLAIALAVMGYMFEVTESREDSNVGLAVQTAASRYRADTNRYRPSRAEEGSTSKTSHQRLAETDQALLVEAEAKTSHHVGTKAIEAEKMMSGNRPAASDDAVTPGSESLDRSVEGQPFQVSESILAACKKSRRDRTCELGMPLLAKMAEEPREDPWATSAERAIRALVELEPGTDRPREVNYTIRNLECRKTICFVETASHMQGFSTQLFYFERDGRLKAGYAMFSTETKEDGTTVFVKLLPVMRLR